MDEEHVECNPNYGITRTSTMPAGYAYSLLGNSADAPVTYVNWGDAARFVNWLQNGEPNRPGRPRHDGDRNLRAERQHGQRGAMAVTAQYDGNMGFAECERMVQSQLLCWRRS